jgi:hypothetical protein
VRAVARAHGGNVTVSSTAGEGSTFELTLPAPADARLALAAGGIADAAPALIAETEEESIRR